MKNLVISNKMLSFKCLIFFLKFSYFNIFKRSQKLNNYDVMMLMDL